MDVIPKMIYAGYGGGGGQYSCYHEVCHGQGGPMTKKVFRNTFGHFENQIEVLVTRVYLEK